MSESVNIQQNEPQATPLARAMLLKRLIDIVAMPGSLIPYQDRTMAGDVLLEMLIDAKHEELLLCARRLIASKEAPNRVLKYLTQCDIEVSGPLLKDNSGLQESDLLRVAEIGSTDHCLAMAKRKDLSQAIIEALVGHNHFQLNMAVLKNTAISFSQMAIDTLVTFSREHPQICSKILERPEVTPFQAMTLFWWAPPEFRKHILMRYAADRTELIERCSDVFKVAAQENWSDPLVEQVLQLIERRQRNRTTLERSQFSSLEDVINSVSIHGMDQYFVEEISYHVGLKPVTGAKILTDQGGEPIAVLCKAVRLKREYFHKLWVTLRDNVVMDGEEDIQLLAVSEIYEMLSVAKAQTILRYWNWSLSSSLLPKNKFVDDLSHSPDMETELPLAHGNAGLAFGD